MNKIAKGFIVKALQLVIIFSLIMPASLLENIGILGIQTVHAAELHPSTGIFRTLVYTPDDGSLLRLEKASVKILHSSEWTLILATSVQLEELVKLGLRTSSSVDVGALVATNSGDYSKKLLGLESHIKQASALWIDVETSRRDDLVVYTQKSEAVSINLAKIIAEFSSAELNAIAALISSDSDGDGLTDTEERWWCTDPYNPYSDPDSISDGNEVTQLLAGNNAYGKPFIGWPTDHAGCYDDDYDSIPDLAEIRVIGLNPNRESTDGDKFDDGQEFFGLTKYPGYGALPRAEDTFITASMPGWVDPPGNSPFVAAYPKIHFEIIESSLEIELVTQITTGESHSVGESFSYATTNTNGTSTGVGKEDSHTYSQWQEVGNSIADGIEKSTYQSQMNSHYQEYSYEHSVGASMDIEYGQNSSNTHETQWSAGLGQTFGNEVSAEVNVAANPIELADLTVGASHSSSTSFSGEYGQSDSETKGESWSARLGTSSQTTYGQTSGYEVAYETGTSLSVSQVHERSQNIGSGYESGQSTTITREDYSEIAITNENQIATSQEWSTATAVNTNHAADLTFGYRIHNTGTDSARQINNILFNIFIEGARNPITTYAAVLQGDTCAQVTVNNLYPENTFPSNGTVTHCNIPLSLEQLALIDLGATMRVVVADYSYGDDQQFYENAWGQGVIVEVDDGTADGDEGIDTYLIPTWGDETYQDVIRRYFSVTETAQGDILSVFTPEYDANHRITSWNEHAISGHSWWNIYLSDYGDGYFVPFRERSTSSETHVLMRFNKDTDRDFFSDRAEQAKNTSINDPKDHPNAAVFAGYYEEREGNSVKVQMALENLGNFDAVGVQAMMFTFDDTVTIDSSLVGMAGFIPSGNKVLLTSKILRPNPLTWSGTAQPVVSGHYTGNDDNRFTFTVSSNGQIGATSGLNLDWTDQYGDSGSIAIGSGYLPPSAILVKDGVSIGLGSGLITAGNRFEVEVLAPRDVFKYTINQEPYTQPLIVVSYNDPKGNKRFVTPVKLTNIHEDLWAQADKMLPVPDLSIISEQSFQPGVDNTTVYSVINPLNTAIEDGYLWIAYAESLTGKVVLTKVIETSFLPGPNLFSDTWNTNDFIPGYEPGSLYKVKVFATDREYHPFDVAFSQFADLGTSQPARLSATTLSVNLGEISKGEVRYIPFSYANTGFSNLWIGISQSSPIELLSEPIVQNLQPGATSSVDLVFDTSDLPLGSFTQTLPIRTNDLSKPYISLTIIGTIVAPNGNVTSYLYDENRPWDEYVYVLGPQTEHTPLSYTSSINQSVDVQPIYLLDEQDDLVGKSNVIVDAVGGQTILYAVQGQFPEEYIQAAQDEDRDVSDALELLEYRTPYSRVYVWPDGYGMAISEIVDTSDLVNDSSSNCTANADGYVHWYYGGAYPQFGQSHMYLGNYLYFYKEKARSYIKFCLPSLPQYNSVNSASMYLYMYSPNGTNTISSRVYQVTSSWSESAPFDANHQPGLSGPIDSRDINKSVGWKNWNITNLVRNWYGGTPNYGVMLAANPENSNGMAFYTRENGSNRPYLSVSFTLNVPASPILSTITNIDNIGDYAVSWPSVPNTTSYKLFEQKDGGSWNAVYTGTSSSSNLVGRAAGAWCYKVQAVNSAGSSSDSNIQCTVVKPTSAPILTDILNNGDESYTVGWSSVPGAISYVLEEGLNGNNWISIYSGIALSYDVLNRTSGNWCYRVKAVNSGGSTEWSSTKCAIVNTAPSIPENLLPVDGAELLGRRVVFSWIDAGDSDNAPQITRNFTLRVWNLDTGWNFTSDLLSSSSSLIALPDDGRYKWQVRSYDGLEYSAWSAEKTFSVHSIATTGLDQVTVSIPSAISSYERFHVQYGIPVDIAVPNQNDVVFFDLSKRTYVDVRFDIVLANSETVSPTIKIDIGNDGQDVLVQELVWSGNPEIFGSVNLAPAIDNFLSQSNANFGSIVEIPVAVSLDAVGQIVLTNLVLSPGIDKDLSVTNTAISLDVLSPTEGMEVVVQADIRNIGYLESGPVSVSYYSEFSDGSVEHIGSDFISNIAANQTISSQIAWKTLGFSGSVPVRVVIDPNEDINESSKTNNQAEKEFDILTRPDLHVVSMNFSNEEPVVGEAIAITFDIENLGQAESIPSILALLNKGTVTNQNDIGVSGGSYAQIPLDWTPSAPGLYRLEGIADYSNAIGESNENNNQIWKDIYVGFSDRILIDGGGSTDQSYTAEKGYGYLDPGADASNFCGNLPNQTHRKDNDGDINYRFDHLLPGHYYHLNVVFYECDGLARQQSITVDDSLLVDVVELGDSNVHQISLRLDPALYADRSINVQIKELTGYDVIVSEINLIDIDYRYADSGGVFDPAYPSNTKLKYGWLDGEKNITWGQLPHQTRRIDLADSNSADDPDNELRYRFDGLNSEDSYKLSFVFYQQSVSSVLQEILVDGERLGDTTLNGTQRKDLELQIPSNLYQTDGSIIVTIRRPGVLTGAFVNEIALEEITIGGGMPTVKSITRIEANPTNAKNVEFLVTFSEAVTDVDVTDFSLLTSGDLIDTFVTNVTGINNIYTVTVDTGAGNGRIRLDVLANDSIKDLDGNSLERDFTSGEEYVIDRIAPDTSFISFPNNPSSHTSATFTFGSSEDQVTFECNLDDSLYASCSSPKVYSGLSEGMHTLDVRAKDAAGNIDMTVAAFTWTVDTIAPNTNLDTYPSSPNNQTSATLTFSSLDNAATFECSLNGGNYSPCISPKTYTALSEGLYEFNVRARDTAGNIDLTPATSTWSIDTTAPNTNLITQPANPSNQISATFTFSSLDNIATFECSLNGGAYTSCTSPKTYSSLLEGSHTFYVRARDAAGNIDPIPAGFTWIVDTTAPETNIVSYPVNPSNQTSATFTFSSLDASTTFECRLDGSSYVSCTNPKAYSSLSEGSHTFYVRAKDAAGNIDLTPASFTWIVDSPPDTNIISNPANPSNQISATFTFSSLDNIATFECSLNGGAYTSCTSPKTYSSLLEGSHTFYVRARDAAGNIDPIPAGFTWIVDTTAPDTNIVSYPANPSNQTSATFTFSSLDASTTFECRLDGSSYVSCTNPKAYSTLSEGSHTFYVRAKDAAGNIDLTPDSFTWIVNSVALSTINSARTDSNPTNATNVNFAVTFSKPVIGLETNDFMLTTNGTITGTSVVSILGNDGDETFIVTVNTGSGDGDLRLDIPDSASISDLYGNMLTDLPYTRGQSYSIIKNRNPSDINISASSIAEGQPVGTAVGAFTTSDPDTEDTFTYALVAGTGDSDNAAFAIAGNTLRAAQSFNYAFKNSYSIRVSTTDNGGLSFEKVFTITINDHLPVFSDVPDSYWAVSFIERLYNSGITGGCSTVPVLKYCPDNTVTRAQMAVFLLKSMHGKSYTPPLVGDSTGFGDVATSHWAAAWIKQLAAEGITGGCGNGNYCPENPVTRAQMAVFLLKAKNGSGYTPPALGDGSGFGDVPNEYWAARWIKQLAAEGITGGCGAGNYCPENPVTRAQMAVFIVKTFGLP